MKTLIKNVKIVNEGKIFEGDILIENDLISKIDSQISEEADQIIDGSGKYLLPGVIDDQVHFREPGLTHKGDIETESEQPLQEERPVLSNSPILFRMR
jgi:dihydroorotase